jgi:hypothetical protein
VTVYDVETRLCLGVFRSLQAAGKELGFCWLNANARMKADNSRVLPFKGLVIRFGVPICPHCNKLVAENIGPDDDDGIGWRRFPCST